MNLHRLASAAVGVVNQLFLATLRVSDGYTIGADLRQVPQYRTIPGVPVQVQALSSSDLRQMDGLNIQSTHRAIYVNGDVQGVNRSDIKGGDLFTFPDGTEWLVVQALESWPNWSKLGVTQQIVGQSNVCV